MDTQRDSMARDSNDFAGLVRRHYFSVASILLLALTVLGFSDNLFTNVGQKSNSDPKFIAHGLFCLAWMTLLVVQANLVGRGNIRLHRTLGVAGVAIAAGVVLSTLWVFVAVWKGWDAMQVVGKAMGDLYANPAASQFMLDDAAFDVEAWLASEIATEFARAEGAAFVNGNGTNRPRGFLQSPTASTSDASRAFGTLQYVASGAAGAFAASNPQDRLVDLVQALRPPYRQGAVWVMNSKTLATVRKFKTTDGAFLWQPGLTEGNADRLLGYPVVEAEDMPDIATDSLSIAFGNFRSGYLIAERGETAILRDPYTSKPYVYFYATKRVGGCVANSEAIKVMKFAAS